MGAIICVAALMFCARADAQTAISWSSTSSGTWGTGTNWTGGSAPANSLTTNYAYFNNATGVTVTTSTGQSVAGIDFGASAGAYTLSNTSGGNRALTIGSHGITNSSSNNQVITGSSSQITLGAASTFTVGGSGNLTISTTGGNLVTTATNTLTLRGTGTGLGTISSLISGAGTITKLDSGSWTLSNASNSFSGGLIIGSSNGASGGTLTMGASNVLGSGNVTIYGGTLATGTFTDTIGALTLGGGASGTTANITGTGTITLGGTLTYDASNNPGGATIAANIGLGANRTITVGNSTGATTDLTMSGVVSGAFNITKSGTGTLSLANAANTYSGTTTISQGTIQVDANAPSGANGALGNASSTITLNDGSTGANNTALLIGTSGVSIGRTVTVANSGTGTATLGTNLTSGTATFTGNITLNKGASFNADGTSNVTFSTGVISGTGALTKTGTGIVTLSGANTYTGGTNINAGTLALGSSGALNSSGNITFGGGTLQYSSSNTTDYSARFFNSTGAIAIDTNSQSVTFATGISNTNTGGFTKSGAGTLTLSSANSFSGGLTLNAGTLNLNNAGALGTGTFTINGGTIDNTTAAAITLSGNNAQAWNGNFTFTGTKDLNLGTGAVTLGATPTITVSGGNLTVGGVVSGSNLGVTKAGSGTLVLTGASTFTGKTSVQDGTLSVSSLNKVSGGSASSNLGAPTTVANGTIDLGSGTTTGTLKYTGTGETTDRVINLAGSTGGGTIDSSGSGTLTFTGNLTAAAGSKTLTLTGTNTTAAVFSGNIVDSSGTVALAKTGAGTWNLTGTSNTYSGGTTVSAGTLNVQSGSSLGSSSGALVVNGGTLNLNNTAQTVGSFSGSGGTVNLASGNTFTVADTGTHSFSGALSGSGNFTFSGSGGNLTLSGNSSSYTGAVSVTQGTLIAGSNNALGTGTAGTTVSSGATLGLSGSGLSVSNGTLNLSGTLSNISGSSTNRWNNNITLGGAATINAASGQLTLGPDSPSAVITGSSVNESGYITLGNATTGNNLTFTGSGTIFVNSRIQDYSGQTAGSTWSGTTQTAGPGISPVTSPGSVTINMSGGTVQYYANANTYTGTTFVKNGTLILDTLSNGSVSPHNNSVASFHSLNGPLVIGNGTSSATVQLGSTGGANEVMAIGTTVQIYSDGTLNMRGQTQTIDALTFTGSGSNASGGAITLGTYNSTGGHLYLNNDVTFNASASGQTATISSSGGSTGYVSMTLNRTSGIDTGADATRTFTVNGTGGDTSASLTIDAVIQNGSLVKAGNATLTLKGNNDYTGTTTVSAGILNVQAGTDGSGHSALGSSDGTTAQGTTVANGATLQIQGGIAITNELLTLNGDGYASGKGALQNVSGNNTWGTANNAYINLATDSRINSDAGTLTIVSNISSTSSNKALTVGGAGNTTISGQINTGSGSTTTLTKDGTGTVTLSGSNGYQGNTTVSAGVLVAANNGALGATSNYAGGYGGTTVASGAQLQLSGGITVGTEALTLNGTGLAATNTGALNNASGTNTFGGTITFGTTARIQNDVAGNSLALTGGLKSSGSSGIDLNFTGAGNITVSGDTGTGSGSGSASNKTIDAGSSTLTKGSSASDTGTLSLALTAGSTNTVGQTHLQYGNLNVSGSVSTLNTAELNTLSGTTLTIASGATLSATYGSGTSTTIAGQLAGSGTLKLLGSGTTATVTISSTQTSASNLNLIIGGSTVGSSNLSNYFKLVIGAGANVTVGSIRITGDTILDFSNSASTVLSSTTLTIDAGVKISVQNWSSLSTAWYVQGTSPTINGTSFGTLGDQIGSAPLNQITFTGYSATQTTWVSTQGGQYFDHEIRPTPEPATYGAIFLGACLGLLGWRRWRNRAART